MSYRSPRMMILAVVLAPVLILGGCATDTPYQPAGTSVGEAAGGYGETQLGADRWRVTFSGNGLTSRQTVETYLLYRSAELTKTQGYDWFGIVDHQTDTQTQLQSFPRQASGPQVELWGPHWRYRRNGLFGGWRDLSPDEPEQTFEVLTVAAYVASAEIVMGRGAKPVDDPAAFEARAVLQKLGPEVERPR